MGMWHQWFVPQIDLSSNQGGTWGKGEHLSGFESYTVKDIQSGFESHTSGSSWSELESHGETDIHMKVKSYEMHKPSLFLDVGPIGDQCFVNPSSDLLSNVYSSDMLPYIANIS